MANERKYSANPAVIQVDATELTDVHFVAVNWDKLRRENTKVMNYLNS